MKVLVLATLAWLSMSAVQGNWMKHEQTNTAQPDLKDYSTRHFSWQNSDRPAEESSGVHYHYDYQYVDHVHNLQQGNAPDTKAQDLAMSPLVRQPASSKDVKETFKYSLPEGVPVEEVYHYEYTYAYHQHNHDVSQIDAKSIPWWETPAAFRISTREPLAEKTIIQAADVNTQEKPFLPADSEEIKVEQEILPEQSEAQNDQSYVTFPSKTSEGTYDFVRLPLNIAEQTAPEDESKHYRYLHRNQKSQWNIPQEDQSIKTEVFESTSSKDTESVSPLDILPSIPKKVVVHYHINHQYHLHDHNIKYVEGEQTEVGQSEKQIPVVLPGAPNDQTSSNYINLEAELKQKHPEDSQMHYSTVIGEVQREHRQQVYPDGQISSQTGSKTATMDVFSYTPVQEQTSSNHAHFTYMYMSHQHSHLVLLRSSAPPAIDALQEREMDVNGELENDMELYRLQPIVDDGEVEAVSVAEEVESISWIKTLVLMCGMVLVGRQVYERFFKKKLVRYQGYHPLLE